MNKGNFILGFKRSIFLVIPFLVTSCGGGVTQKYTDGSKFYFKGENINCEWDYYSDTNVLDCKAYGVRTYLNGYKANYSEGYSCKREDKDGNAIFKQIALADFVVGERGNARVQHTKGNGLWFEDEETISKRFRFKKTL